MSGGGGEGAVYDGCSLKGKDFLDEIIEERTEKNPEFPNMVEGAKELNDAIEILMLCAQDIVDGWPTLTFRTIGQMTKKVDDLKQALEAIKKIMQ